MTLKPIENEFSEKLLAQNKAHHGPYDLSLKAPLFEMIHPKVLWAQLNFERNPEQDEVFPPILGFSYQCFKDLNEASCAHPEVEVISGRVGSFFNFFHSQKSIGLIDFSPLGVVCLSRNPLPEIHSTGVHLHTLPHWLYYATSPELWGPQGKWTRFHSRLHELLTQKNLLESPDSPGHYPLKIQARKLQEHGFIGSVLDKTYLLVLPWTFPLGALEKLEQVIRQEF